ncbi:DUF6504 family protein [Nocardioides zeicaulis]|uniref:DUF6504 family protein n=1 Tax=Nocardioides zeicaulis TaxID=1776857 RepID=A0ABV6DX32_9ACTN
MKEYDDPVEVRRGEAEDPEQFLWRGRLWKVRAVLAHGVGTGPRWQAAVPGHDAAPAQPGPSPETSAARELWRVEAGRGMAGSVRLVDGAEPEGLGVFDLSFDRTDGRWQLVGCQD